MWRRLFSSVKWQTCVRYSVQVERDFVTLVVSVKRNSSVMLMSFAVVLIFFSRALHHAKRMGDFAQFKVRVSSCHTLFFSRENSIGRRLGCSIVACLRTCFAGWPWACISVVKKSVTTELRMAESDVVSSHTSRCWSRPSRESVRSRWWVEDTSSPPFSVSSPLVRFLKYSTWRSLCCQHFLDHFDSENTDASSKQYFVSGVGELFRWKYIKDPLPRFTFAVQDFWRTSVTKKSYGTGRNNMAACYD